MTMTDEELKNEYQHIENKIKILCHDELFDKVKVINDVIAPIVDVNTLFTYDAGDTYSRALYLTDALGKSVKLICHSDSTVSLNYLVKSVNPHPISSRPSVARAAEIHFKYDNVMDMTQYIGEPFERLNDEDKAMLKQGLNFTPTIAFILTGEENENKVYINHATPTGGRASGLPPELKIKFLQAKYNMLIELNDSIDKIKQCIISELAKMMSLNMMPSDVEIDSQFNQLAILNTMFKPKLQRLNSIQLESYSKLQPFFEIMEDIIPDLGYDGTSFTHVAKVTKDFEIQVKGTFYVEYDDGDETENDNEVTISIMDKTTNDRLYQIAYSTYNNSNYTWSTDGLDLSSYTNGVYPDELILATKRAITIRYAKNTSIDKRIELAQFILDSVNDLIENIRNTDTRQLI